MKDRKEEGKLVCTICIEEIDVEKAARVSGCQHRFCYECINHWANKCSNNCPNCIWNSNRLPTRAFLGKTGKSMLRKRRWIMKSFTYAFSAVAESISIWAITLFVKTVSTKPRTKTAHLATSTMTLSRLSGYVPTAKCLTNHSRNRIKTAQMWSKSWNLIWKTLPFIDIPLAETTKPTRQQQWFQTGETSGQRPKSRQTFIVSHFASTVNLSLSLKKLSN